jgi:replicative DNA helicase
MSSLLPALLTSRVPPHDVAVERAVLGCVLIDGATALSRVAERLQADDFHLERHRTLWRTHLELVADEMDIDLTTVRNRLPVDVIGSPLDAAVWLAELEAEAATLTSLASYATIVRRDGARRRLIQHATDVITRAYEAQDPHAIAVAGAETLGRIAEHAQLDAPKPPARLHPLSTIVQEVVEALEQGQPPALLELPYPGLNYFLGGGLAGGELVMLGAWPGVGKSAIAGEFASHAGRNGRTVLIMSLEMKRHALARRIIAQQSQIDAMGLRRGRLEAGDMAALRFHLRAIIGLPIWITDDAVSIVDLDRLAASAIWRPRLGLVIVDYLQLVEASADAESHRLGVEEVSGGLKRLAMKLDVPVICLSALSRASEPNRARRPTKADLRESGKLEHDADIVLLLHRPDQMQAETEVIIDKARDASVGVVRLRFHPASLRFTEVSDRVGG